MGYLFNVNAKFALRLTLLLFPIIVIYAKLIISRFMFTEIDNTDNMFMGYLESGQKNLASEGNITGLGGLIRTFLERSPYYMIAFLGFRTLTSNVYDDIPSNLRAFIIIRILIVVFSSIFLFDFNANTQTLYGRFLRYDAIPTVIVMTYLYQSGFYRKLTTASICIAGCGTAYTITYAFYCALHH